MRPAIRLPLIALVGHAGVGKDTVASYLPGGRFSFAGPLKEITGNIFGFSREQLYGPSACRNVADPRYTRADGVALTPRYALQIVGDTFRQLHPTIWAQVGVRRALEWLKNVDGDLAVITDCRFVNEAQAVRAAGGQVWRVVRPGHELPPEISNHVSETEQDTPAMDELVDFVINNNGTLEQLRTATEVAFVLARSQWSDSL